MAELTFEIPELSAFSEARKCDLLRVTSGEGRRTVGEACGEDRVLTVSWSGPSPAVVQFPLFRNKEIYSVATSCLRACKSPYRLANELARGVISRVKSSWAEAEPFGWTPSESAVAKLHRAVKLFNHAIRGTNSTESDALALESLLLALEVGDSELLEFSKYQIDTDLESIRSRIALRIPMGSEATPWESIASIIDRVVIDLSWDAVEFERGKVDWSWVDSQVRQAREAGLLVGVGPLVRLGGVGMPSWLLACAHDETKLVTHIVDWVERCLDHFRDSIWFWEIVSPVNRPRGLSIGVDGCLCLSSGLLDMVQERIPGKGLAVRVVEDLPNDQRVGRGGSDAILAAETISRLESRPSRLNIEIATPQKPTDWRRSLLDFAKLIDGYETIPIKPCLEFSMTGESADALATVALAKPFIEGITLNFGNDKRPVDWAMTIDFLRHLTGQTVVADRHD